MITPGKGDEGKSYPYKHYIVFLRYAQEDLSRPSVKPLEFLRPDAASGLPFSFIPPGFEPTDHAARKIRDALWNGWTLKSSTMPLKNVRIHTPHIPPSARFKEYESTLWRTGDLVARIILDAWDQRAASSGVAYEDDDKPVALADISFKQPFEDGLLDPARFAPDDITLSIGEESLRTRRVIHDAQSPPAGANAASLFENRMAPILSILRSREGANDEPAVDVIIATGEMLSWLGRHLGSNTLGYDPLPGEAQPPVVEIDALAALLTATSESHIREAIGGQNPEPNARNDFNTLSRDYYPNGVWYLGLDWERSPGTAGFAKFRPMPRAELVEVGRLEARTLMIDAVTTQNPAPTGTPVSYRVSVTNTGSIPLQNLMVTCTLPDGVRFEVQGSTPDASIAGSIVHFRRIPLLRRGEVATLDLVVSSLTARVAESIVEVAGDFILRPRRKVITTNFVDAGPAPAILLDLRSFLDPAAVGETVIYSVRATNQGSQSATGLTLTCTAEPGLSLNGIGGRTTIVGQGSELSMSRLASLAPGEVAEWRFRGSCDRRTRSRITAVLKVDGGGGPVRAIESTSFFD